MPTTQPSRLPHPEFSVSLSKPSVTAPSQVFRVPQVYVVLLGVGGSSVNHPLWQFGRSSACSVEGSKLGLKRVSSVYGADLLVVTVL